MHAHSREIVRKIYEDTECGIAWKGNVDHANETPAQTDQLEYVV